MRSVGFATALCVGILWSRPSSADVPEVGGEVGFSQRTLYGVPIESASFTGAIGGRTSSVAYDVPLRVDWGKTLEGLTVAQGGVGLRLESIVGRARFGGGFSVGMASISRVTRNDTFAVPCFEVFLRISADIVRFGAPRLIPKDGTMVRPALYVASELRVNTAQIWGPSLFLGVRY